MPKSNNKNLSTILPPHNAEAERSVVGAMLVDQDAIYKVADFLIPDDFYDPQLGTIYLHILELTEKRKPIDIVTLTDHLESKKKLSDVGGASAIASLAATIGSSAHIVSHAQIVKTNSTMRRLISAGGKIVELGFQVEKDADELLDEAEQIIFGVSKGYLKDSFVPIQSVLTSTFERIDELHKNKGQLRGIPSGFPPLDNLLAGLQPSDLIIIAARPSMGKTTLALNIAANAAKTGVPVGIFSLEQSKDQLVDRMLVAEAQVDSWKLRVGKLDDDDFPRIGHAMGVLSEAPIFIDDSPMNNIMQIRAKARRLQAEHKLGLLIIDYLQLMEGRTKSNSDNRVQEISEISRSLKGIARELNIPVIALSQLSRAVEQRHPKIPQLADLRDSGCLASDTPIMDTMSGKLINIADATEIKSTNVLTLNSGNIINSTAVKKAFSTGKKHTYQITTASGKTIKATANHKFLKLDGWTRLDKLQVGQHIATPRIVKYSPSGTILNDDELTIIGQLIGDGCTLARQPIHYTNADLQCHKAVSKAAKNLFGITPKLVKQKNWYHSYLPSPNKLARGKRNPIAKWFDELGIFNLRAKEKKLPGIIFTQPLPKIATFLSHLFATDGSITNSKNNWRIYYTSSSYQLIIQLQHLLLRFGIVGRVSSSKKENYDPTFYVDISGKDQQLLFCQKIGIFGKKSQNVKLAITQLEKVTSNPNCEIIPNQIWKSVISEFRKQGLTTRQFHSLMGWAYSGTSRYKNGISRTRLMKISQKLNSKLLKDIANSDIYWDEIVSIKPAGFEQVYDLTIDITHNFVAGDIIVHNSIEQDADVVGFIYREEYYDPDTDRKNIADLLIKKHRHGPIGTIELYFKPEHMRFTAIETKRDYSHE